MRPLATSTLTLQSAACSDLPFAKELIRVNMRDYYSRYGLIWQPDAFDAEWPIRQNYLINRLDDVIGYLGLTREAGYLYVRDVQLIEPHRGEGVGTWVMEQIAAMARLECCASVRLKVFKSNPAVALYSRAGYTTVGEEQALLWMELAVR
jgi:GNAT superfamily N-acetyltransferase